MKRFLTFTLLFALELLVGLSARPLLTRPEMPWRYSGFSREAPGNHREAKQGRHTEYAFSDNRNLDMEKESSSLILPHQSGQDKTCA
ncbi:MAG: hypothetical protein ACOYIS_04305 [Candidatus Cloacimonadaceae bacterium]